MAPADEPPAADPDDPFDRLQHDLKTPLTAIYGRAQLLTRAVQRSPSLAAAERAALLAGLAAIEAAARAQAAVIHSLTPARLDGPAGPEARGAPADGEDPPPARAEGAALILGAATLTLSRLGG